MTYEELRQYVKGRLGGTSSSPIVANLNPLISNAIGYYSIDINQIHSDDEKERFYQQFLSLIPFCGDCLDYFPGIELSDEAFKSVEPNISIPAGIKYLLNNSSVPGFSEEKFSAAFKLDSPEKFTIARSTLMFGLANISLLLKENNDEKIEWLLTINRDMLLAFFVFMHPNIEENIIIPQKIGDEWRQSAYKIHRIPLSAVHSDWLHDDDTVYAYGFTPVAISLDQHLQPFLVFRGTPPFKHYQGVTSARAADFQPDHTVGEILIKNGYPHLEKWIIATYEQTKSKIRLTGHSLGGSCSLLTALAFPDLISEVNAFNPTGIEKSTLSNQIFNKNVDEKPLVNVFKNYGDTVPQIGYWLETWNIYNIISTLTPKSIVPSIKAPHVCNYLGQSQFIIYQSNPLIENKYIARKVITAGKNIVNFIGATVCKMGFWHGQTVKEQSELDLTEILVEYKNKTTFEEKLEIFKCALKDRKVRFDDPSHFSPLESAISTFIVASINTLQEAVLFFDAVGFGRNQQAGTDEVLSLIRIKPSHQPLRTKLDYTETKLSLVLYNQLKDKVWDIINSKNSILSEEEGIICEIIFSFSSEKKLNLSNELQKYNKKIATNEITIQTAPTLTDTKSLSSSSSSSKYVGSSTP